ncbi:DUF5516 domain-containing protein [Planomicrobium sp. MB-3u-38]|uniref:DUF5516 domain-containing protein n=1 Tax=Planomicrobium sp. MB-3u-38 TaxID=2058318 RepID=UPI000C7E16D5|nr:DUF5516 domain-containing protein [Planomicrobium sp. MB-3u-38]PKH08522.1 hypothetical protein CXF70_16580 [Planomicrobium sp. MB-3u-38]
MAWLKSGKLISNIESQELISKGYQFVEGVLLSPDDVNDLIKSGYTRSHLAEGLRYTFTSTEAKSLKNFGVKVLGTSLVSFTLWNVGNFAKSKISNGKKENL